MGIDDTRIFVRNADTSSTAALKDHSHKIESAILEQKELVPAKNQDSYLQHTSKAANRSIENVCYALHQRKECLERGLDALLLAAHSSRTDGTQLVLSRLTKYLETLERIEQNTLTAAAQHLTNLYEKAANSDDQACIESLARLDWNPRHIEQAATTKIAEKTFALSRETPAIDITTHTTLQEALKARERAAYYLTRGAIQIFYLACACATHSAAPTEPITALAQMVDNAQGKATSTDESFLLTLEQLFGTSA